MVRGVRNLGATALLALVAGTLIGCGSGTDELTISAVDAPKIPRQLATTISITGHGFTALVTVDLGSDDPPIIDDDMRVEIGGTPIAAQDITLVDSETIAVLVPAGLALGLHDVRVLAPDGRDAILADALTIADAFMQIEDAAAGTGAEMDGATLPVGSILDAHAITRFVDDGAFIRDEPATWSVAGTAGTLDVTTGTTTTFTAVEPGITLITASSTIFGDDESGTIVVVEDVPGMVPPLVSISVTPGIGDTTTLFTADATGTVDYDEPAVNLTYQWDWTDDGTFDDAGLTATHTYATTGDFRVVLRVTDSDGLAAFASFEVIVTSPSDIIVVTTANDENDPSATPTMPGGTGLSLREAIMYANGLADRQRILVPGGLIIVLATPLPPLTDDSGADIIGDGATIDGAGNDCFTVQSNDNRITGFELHSCRVAIGIENGAGNRAARCSIHDNMHGVVINADDNTVGPNNDLFGNTAEAMDLDGKTLIEHNRVHDNPEGIFIQGGSDASVIAGNTIFRNSRGVHLQSNTMSIVIVHNTIVDQMMEGVFTSASSDAIDFRNNIVTGSGTTGLGASDARFATRDHNLYFDNAGGFCSACSVPGPNSVEMDPLYMLAAVDDYRLLPGSPAVDAGFDLGIDVNGPEPGGFDAAAPDIGAWESPY